MMCPKIFTEVVNEAVSEALEEIKRLVDEIFTLINNPTEEIE